MHARDRAAQKYNAASYLLAEITQQGRQPCLSSLVFDEFWWIYLNALHRSARGAPFDAQMYKRDASISQAYWPTVEQATRDILAWPNVQVLDSPANLPQQAALLMTTNHLAPRDAFHVALALHHAVPYFATTDSDLDRLQIPVGALTILKLV
jgi:predicted nucleic acid-binding protein